MPTNCERCKRAVESTGFELGFTFCNIFTEGEAYPEHIWKFNLCYRCLKEVHAGLDKLFKSPSNAFHDYRHGGGITRFDQPSETERGT